MTDMEFTGERFVPEKSPAKLEAEHRSRYELALNFVEGRDVIDIGCGEGYGSYMLMGKAKSVTGVDVDKAAIKHAQKMYEADNLNFHEADVAKLPFPDNAFDASVCFEVLEHIANPRDLLREAARVIKPSGIFLISTPNGAVKISSQKNPFHVKEYTVREFSTMLREFFPDERWTLQILGQFVKGRKYSKFSAILKNIYLTIKGALGIKPKEEIPAGQGGPGQPTEYEYLVDNVELAEFILAILGGR